MAKEIARFLQYELPKDKKFISGSEWKDTRNDLLSAQIFLFIISKSLLVTLIPSGNESIEDGRNSRVTLTQNLNRVVTTPGFKAVKHKIKGTGRA